MNEGRMIYPALLPQHMEVLLKLFCFFFSKPDMSRLRLAAGSAIVKLAQEPCYHEIITLEQYQLCALAINVRAVASGDTVMCSWAYRKNLLQ